VPKGKQLAVSQNLHRIEELAKQGKTDGQIATICGVSPSTFSEYKRRNPNLSEALRRGRSVEPLSNDLENIEKALVSAATGYTYNEVIKVPVLDKDDNLQLDEYGNPIMQIAKIIEKWSKPDISAVKFVLSNLKPQTWGDNRTKVIEVVESEELYEGDI